MTDTAGASRELDSFSPLDLHFGALMQRLSGSADPLIGLSAALASFAVQNGHSCLDLNHHAGAPVMFDNAPPGITHWPELDRWIAFLTSVKITGKPEDYAPLILDRARLYLQRYWKYERNIVDHVRKRCSSPLDSPDRQLLMQILSERFPDQTAEIDWQKVAVAAGTFKKFLVISGGPGTGKTSTIIKLITALNSLAGERPLRIAFAAPTGKAAIRLQEAFSAHLAGTMNRSGTGNRDPIGALTLHALLKPRAHSPYFKHDRSNPLPLDCLVVDEASMVDQALMSKVFDALPEHCRVILVGDKDQLASVEAGAVLGDLCDRDSTHSFSQGMIGALQSVIPEFSPTARTEPGLADSIIILRKSFRFDDRSGIGTISRLVREGASEEALKRLKNSDFNDLSWWTPPSYEALVQRLREIVADHLSLYLREQDPAAALLSFNQNRILCAIRKGPFGVIALNHLIERMLLKQGLVTLSEPAYRGKPIMVTRNDYSIDLFNGDTGIFLPAADGTVGLKVFFPVTGAGTRAIQPHRLPPYETTFAMTVHKAQGSEFDRTVVILPPEPHPLVTRELLYTALSRARSNCELWATEQALVSAIRMKTIRTSGLRDALWR
jgi:exodeoxyribonuclease V alpha subunit